MTTISRRHVRHPWPALVCAAALAPRPVEAQVDTSSTATLPADLSAIERALAADQAAVEPRPAAPTAVLELPRAVQAILPDIALLLDVALAGFSQQDNLQAGGHDPSANGFNLQQVELSIGGAVDPYFRYDTNIVFGPDGVELEEAYVTTLGLPGRLQARFGQLLTRFGRLNPTHPHAWDFVDQPFALSRVFGGDGNRGLGLELSWLTPLPWYVELLGSSTQAAGEGTARSFYGADDLGVHGLLDFEHVVALKQFFPLSDDLSLFLGLSLATGPNSSAAGNRSDIWGVDLYLKYRPVTYQSDWQLTLQSEWLHRRRRVPDALLSDSSGYVQAQLHYTRHWALAARWELGTPERAGSGAVDPALLLDADWTANRQRVALNLSWWPTEFSRFRLQGSADLPAWREEPIYAVMLAAEALIGAHGAHAF